MRVMPLNKKSEVIRSVKLAVKESFFLRLIKSLKKDLEENLISVSFNESELESYPEIKSKMNQGFSFGQAKSEACADVRKQIENLDKVLQDIKFDDFAMEIATELRDQGITYSHLHKNCDFSLKDMEFHIGDEVVAEIVDCCYKFEKLPSE